MIGLAERAPPEKGEKLLGYTAAATATAVVSWHLEI